MYNPYGPRASYGPRSPEKDFNLETRALGVINDIAEKDKQRAIERYGGNIPLVNKIKTWFNSEGERTSADTLEKAGAFKNTRWRKWLKIGAKVLGGFGASAAMTFGGGLGAILTPTLWSAGLKEGFDGLAEAVEQLHWGKKRTEFEFKAQIELTGLIDQLKEAVHNKDADRFEKLLEEMNKKETEVINAQEINVNKEKKWKLGRAIGSSVLTLGAGLTYGIPLGIHDYDKTATPIPFNYAKLPGGQPVGTLDQMHKVIWKLTGSEFIYNPGEANHALKLTEALTQTAGKGFGKLTILQNALYGNTHMLGHGLPIAEKIGLGSALTYLLGRSAESLWDAKKTDVWKPGTASSVGYMPKRGYRHVELSSPTSRTAIDKSRYTPESKNLDAIESEYKTEEENKKLKEYLDRQNPAYLKELTDMDKKLPKMEKNCRLGVCIPVAFNEYKTIYNTLIQYKDQEDINGNVLNKDKFEILLFINSPDDDVKKQQLVETQKEVERFQKDYPDMRVRFVPKIFKKSSCIGEYRKYVNDLAILRASKNNVRPGQFYMLFHDADCTKLDKKYLDIIVNEMDNNKEINAVATKENFTEEELNKFPLLRVVRRAKQYLFKFATKPEYMNSSRVPGNFYAFRSSIYAKAGGYDKKSTVAEDMELGYRIIEYSKNKDKAFTFLNNIEYEMSPRRYLDALTKNKYIDESYDNFGEQKDIDRSNLPTNLDQLEKLDIHSDEFKSRLEFQLNHIYNDFYTFFFWNEFDKNSEVIKAKARHVDEEKLQEMSIDMVNRQFGNELFDRVKKNIEKSADYLGVKLEISSFKKNINNAADFKIENIDKLVQRLEAKRP